MSKFIIIDNINSPLLRKKLRKSRYCFVKNGILNPYKNKDKNKILICDVLNNICINDWSYYNHQRVLTFIVYICANSWSDYSNYNEYIKNNILYFNRIHNSRIHNKCLCYDTIITCIKSSGHSYMRNTICYAIDFKVIPCLYNASVYTIHVYQ